MTELPFAEPLRYAPFEKGRYEVSAGMTLLDRQPVHGRLEPHVFAFDRELERFVRAKVAARARLHLFYQQAALAPGVRRAVLETMLPKLAQDSGGAVTWTGETLSNAWLGWHGTLDLASGSVSLERFAAPLASVVEGVEPLDALDFLALNVPEDFSIVARSPLTGEDWLACLHVCSPQHWDPRDKIGRDFAAVHAPVGGSGPLIATAPRLLPAMTTKGPFARFAWGLATSDRLEHHPATANHDDSADKPFDPDRTFVRVERQTLTPFPRHGAAFFTIRPYVYSLRELVSDGHAGSLAAALRSMTPEHLAYKGMTAWRDDVASWLERLDVPGPQESSSSG